MEACVPVGTLTAMGHLGVAPSPPVFPRHEDAIHYSEENTATLMRAVVAYNKFHVRRVMKEDSRWFKGWQDLPVHEHPPLSIRRADTKDELLTYVAAWTKGDALASLSGTDASRKGDQ